MQEQLLTEDEVIAALPPWTTQITIRGVGMGVILGAVFSFITMRFSLGPGGVVPTFNMPTGADHKPAMLVAMHYQSAECPFAGPINVLQSVERAQINLGCDRATIMPV